MEYVSGTPLDEWLRARPRPWRRVIEVFVAAGQGLAAAHSAGLVHRDFKPHNVVIADEGRIRVLDFGLARTQGATSAVGATPNPGAVATAEHTEGLTALTVDGTVLGTPGYMAPEQLRGDPLDARSDQYAFCLSLYEALYGTPAFKRGAPEQVLAEMEAERILPPVRSARIPARIRKALARGLSASPDHRFDGMAPLLPELRLPKQALVRRSFAAIGGAVLGAVRGCRTSPTEAWSPAPLLEGDGRNSARRRVNSTGRVHLRVLTSVPTAAA